MARPLSVCWITLAFICVGAGPPFKPFSTCTVEIVQNPVRPACLADTSLPIARLCPDTGLPPFDTITFHLTIIDALGAPYYNAILSAMELDGSVNIATGGATQAITDEMGRGTVTVTHASGQGRVAVCVGGWFTMGEVEARSPDVAANALPTGCALPTTGTSFINASDVTNPSCGFMARFGAVTPGVNQWWDLDCSATVSASDILGQLGQGGVLQHVGHGAPLGARNSCP